MCGRDRDKYGVNARVRRGNFGAGLRPDGGQFTRGFWVSARGSMPWDYGLVLVYLVRLRGGSMPGPIAGGLCFCFMVRGLSVLF